MTRKQLHDGSGYAYLVPLFDWRGRMSEGALAGLIGATSLGCGIVGGVFFAFSSFVMTALGRLPAAEGMAAMRSINRVAVKPLFMAGTAASALLMAGLR
jgi:uncharacterized membrane protein